MLELTQEQFDGLGDVALCVLLHERLNERSSPVHDAIYGPKAGRQRG